MVVESGMQNTSCRQIQNSIASLLMSNDMIRQLQTLQHQRMARFVDAQRDGLSHGIFWQHVLNDSNQNYNNG
jgi:hypothetical protein